jgi:hypothetical protein
MPDISNMNQDGAKRQLDSPPPQPPRQGRSLMSMSEDSGANATPDMSNPAVQIMAAMGDLRRDMMKLSALLPPLAQGIQQVLSGFEQVVPQMVADVVAGNPPGSGGSAMGAPQANAAPTAPPVQTGMQ